MKRKSNKLVAGVGVNDADYPIVRFGETINGKKKREWICPFYKTWAGMLNRCYRKATDNEYSAYIDTTVCEEWYTFSNFKSWMERQDWEDKDLDKDLLTDNNQYSPENCIFIPAWLNTFISGERKSSRYNLVAIHEDCGKYISSPCCGDVVHSSSFVNVKDAINHYHTVKSEYILSLDLPKDLEYEVLKFFDRRRNRNLQKVEYFIEMYPTRSFEVRRPRLPSVGDSFKTFKGDSYTVLEIKSHEDILIEFEDGSTRSVRNNRISDGSIKKPTINNPFVKIKERVDKIFKWNSHGLIAGVQTYPPNYFGVAYRQGKLGKCFYTTEIHEALKFRENMLIDRITKIVGKDVNYLEDALSYFNNRWNTEVIKYSGKLQSSL